MTLKMTPRERVRVQKVFTEPSRTEQAHKMDCDINHLVERVRGGQVIPVETREAMYGDFFEMPTTLAEAAEVLEVAGDMFDNLPAAIRKHFHNDPLELLEATKDVTRQDELEHLGLFKEPEPPPAPPAEPPVEPPPDPAPAAPAVDPS